MAGYKHLRVYKKYNIDTIAAMGATKSNGQIPFAPELPSSVAEDVGVIVGAIVGAIVGVIVGAIAIVGVIVGAIVEELLQPLASA